MSCMQRLRWLLVTFEQLQQRKAAMPKAAFAGAVAPGAAAAAAFEAAECEHNSRVGTRVAEVVQQAVHRRFG